MYKCFWGLNSHKWEIKQFECKTLMSQLLGGMNERESVVGFHCQDDEVEKFVEKLKKSEIKTREIEIKKLKKEIENINKMQTPIIG